jgi:hypothetical protein
MKHNKQRFKSAFDDAFRVLAEAISQEGQMNRIVIHPYMTIFGGSVYYIRHGGEFDRKQLDRLAKLVEGSRQFFAYDVNLMILVNEINQRILNAQQN